MCEPIGHDPAQCYVGGACQRCDDYSTGWAAHERKTEWEAEEALIQAAHSTPDTAAVEAWVLTVKHGHRCSLQACVDCRMLRRLACWLQASPVPAEQSGSWSIVIPSKDAR